MCNTLFAGRRNLNVGMLYAYILASLHAYVLTCLHAYMLRCLPTYMYERWQDSCLHGCMLPMVETNLLICGEYSTPAYRQQAHLI